MRGIVFGIAIVVIILALFFLVPEGGNVQDVCENPSPVERMHCNAD